MLTSKSLSKMMFLLNLQPSKDQDQDQETGHLVNSLFGPLARTLMANSLLATIKTVMCQNKQLG